MDYPDNIMIRRLLRDSAIYGLGQLIYLGLPILSVPLYSRFLEPREYGTLELITVVGALANFVVTLEIGQGLGRYYLDTKDAKARVQFASTALLFALGAYGIFLTLGMAAVPAITVLLIGSSEWERSVQVGLVATCATGIFNLFQNQLRWQLTPKPFLAAAGTSTIVSVAASLLLLTHRDLGPAAVLYGQIAGAACGLAISAWFTRHSFRFVFSVERLRTMLAFSLPLVLSSCSVFLVQFIDRFIIRDLLDMSAVGIYSVGFRMASAANLLLLGLSASLTPLIFERFREPETPPELARIFRGFLFGTITLLVGGSLFAKDLLGLMAGPEYLAAWSLIPLLACASVLARMYIFAPGLDILKATRMIMLINVGSVVLNVVLCYVLIPGLGISGAAIASLVAAAGGFSVYMTLSQRLYPVPHDWRRIFAATALGSTTVIFSGLVETALTPGVVHAAVIKLSLVAITGVVTWKLLRPRLL